MSDSNAPNYDPTQEAIEALASLELSDLVYWTMSILRVPFGEEAVDPSAVACNYALRKVEHYLQAMREAEDRRRDIGLSAQKGIEAADALESTDPEKANRLKQEAILHNDKTEVEIHIFAVSADQIRRLLRVVTETVGVDIDESDAQFLFSYRPLRNQFEHLEERLPGIEKGGTIVLSETSIPSVLLGLRKDNVGRITVQHAGKDIVAEVNEYGYWHVQRIVHEAFDRIRVVCIELLEQHFADHPEHLMDPALYQPRVRMRLLNEDDE